MKIHIDDVCSSELPEPYVLDPNLDVFDQVARAIEFMTFDIPDEHINEDDWPLGADPSPFTYHEFVLMLKTTYKGDANLFRLVEHLFEGYGRDKRTHYRKVINSKKPKRRMEALGSIALMIYEPQDMIKRCFPEDIGIIDPGNKTPEEIQMVTALISETRERLVLDMMQSNSADLKLARNLTFDMGFDESFRYEKFFIDDDRVMSYIRMAFAFITSHIGYIPKPQVRKWEEIYALACFHPHTANLGSDVIDELIETGFKEFDRTPEEIAQDLAYQRIISKQYESHLKYNALKEALSISLTSEKRLKGHVDKLEKKVDRFHKPKKVKAKKQKPINIEAIVQRRLADRLTELNTISKRLKSAEYDRDKYMRLYQESQDLINDLESNLDASLPEPKIIHTNQDEKIILVYHPKLVKKLKKCDLPVDIIADKVARGAGRIDPVKRQDYGWIHRLRAGFNEYDEFMKISYQDWRGAYVNIDIPDTSLRIKGKTHTLPKQRLIVLLDILHHHDYEKQQR